MATQHDLTAMPDTPITVKVALNDVENRRFKLAIKELGANSLPDKLRALLGVPVGQDVVFERFSDSAGCFVLLDSNNPQVYKQLHRAAKAKLRLRLRATYIKPDGTKLQMPSTETDKALPVESATALSSNAPCCITTAPAPISPPAVEPRIQLPTRQKPAPASSHNPSLLDIDLPMGRSPMPLPSGPSSKMNVQKKPYQPKVAHSSARVHPGLENLVDGFGTQQQHEEAPTPTAFTEYAANMADMWKQYPTFYHPLTAFPGTPGSSFSICCNKCDIAIQGPHWHCSICENGDFDLCQSCFTEGVRCDNNDQGTEHWLIHRSVKEGKVITSDTERYMPRRSTEPAPKPQVPGAFASEIKNDDREEPSPPSRTCNACIGVFDESNFVTCTKCEDYDLCVPCHTSSKHGHHPAHSFVPASDDTIMDENALNMCSPGRNAYHRAICDGCDKAIRGIRHKCMTCPDWDFCSSCIVDSRSSHPGHAFVPVYESLYTTGQSHHQSVRHYGIQCDGPLCKHKSGKNYITGDRYKCAVCHDTDFCAACEALPTGHHNKTHPLIKFKTPVRNVSVTAIGEKDNGEEMYTMGDRIPQRTSKSTETVPPMAPVNAATQVQTVAENAPPAVPAKEEKPKHEAVLPGMLAANFVRDAYPDGSSVAPGTSFKQVWTLKNAGQSAWPAGCSVRYIGGDSMFDLDMNQPISVNELIECQSSNVIDRPVEVGEEVEFSVMMRAPVSEGKKISYWRLKTEDGLPFGHKLWCDITVEAPKAPKTASEITVAEPVKSEKFEEASLMVFPKLEKESPSASVHQTELPSAAAQDDDKECPEEAEDVDFDEESSEEGFLTDEEYEMLSGDEDGIPEAKNGKK